MDKVEEIRRSANYDESKVPAYTLPNPLTLPGGHPVTDAATWFEKARPATLRLFETLMYGRTPAKTLPMRSEILHTNPQALGGKATSQQVRLFFTENSDPHIDLLIFLPNAAKKPVPLFLGLNFNGNQAVTNEPDVLITEQWVWEKAEYGMANNRATEASRGTGTENWQAEFLVDRGYGLATFYYGDIDPDFDDGFQNGIEPLFYAEGQTHPASDEWGALGAWAWGLSRALDYLETRPEVDAKKIAVVGHSRLGKAALWAAAQDQRFALVISNNSGSGGAALARRMFGETYAHMNTVFPHWFCQNFHAYSDREADLPFDQHQLLALMAPRPLYVASATEDLWADPQGEYLAAENARPVYNLLLGEAAADKIGYHIRPGGHDINRYDWERYLDFADKHFQYFFGKSSQEGKIMSQEFTYLQVETSDRGVRTITLNRPEKLNAINDLLSNEIPAALEAASRDDSVRVIVVTGAGRGFCAGLDLDPAALAEHQAALNNSRAERLDELGWVGRMALALVNSDKPVIAAINGPAAGAGLGLALGADIRLFSEKAVVTTGYIRRGLAPDAGVSYFLPRLVGLSRATELILTARDIPADEAERIGLASKVLPADNFAASVAAYAAQLAGGPPIALTLTKRLLASSLDRDLPAQLKSEYAAIMKCFGTADVAEAMRAFLEKRPPEFKGR